MFTPGRSSNYRFDLEIASEKVVPSQTFSAVVQFSDASDFSLEAPNRKATVGQHLMFSLRPNDNVNVETAANAKFLTTVKLPSGETANIEPTSKFEGIWRYSYTTTAAGEHEVVAKLHGNTVGSMLLNFLGGVPENPIVFNPGNSTFVANEDMQLSMALFDKYGNDAHLVPGTDIVIQYERQPKGQVVSAGLEIFKHTSMGGEAANVIALAALKQSGSYSLSMKLFGETLCLEDYENCTPVINISPGNASAAVSILQGSGTSDHIAGVQVRVTVVPLDLYGNPVLEEHSRFDLKYALSIRDISGSPVVEKNLEYSSVDNSHAVDYSLTHIGNYSMSVLMVEPSVESGTGVVGGSSTPIEVLAASPSMEKSVTQQVEVDGAAMAVAGEIGAISVTLKDDYSNTISENYQRNLSASIVLPDGFAVEGELHSFSNGVYAYRFMTPISGTYTTSMLVFGEPLANKATMQVLAAKPVPLTSTASGPGLFTSRAGSPTLFYLNGGDRFGNLQTHEQGVFDVAISVEKGSGYSKSISRVEEIEVTWDVSRAAFQVLYDPRVAGEGFVDVKLGGSPILGSPFPLTVAPGPTSPFFSVLEGSGLQGGLLSSPSKFTILARDQYSNAAMSGGDPFVVSVVCSSEKCGSKASVVLSDRNDGSYVAAYTADGEGQYALSVTLEGEHVGIPPVSSPRNVTVKDRPGGIDVRNSYIFGEGSHTARAGTWSSFTIVSVDSDGVETGIGGDSFQVFITGMSSLSTQNGAITVEDNLDGTYLVMYNLAVIGTHQLVVKDGTGQFNLKVPASGAK